MARVRSSDYDAKRGMILNAAAALFAEHGFASTSVSLLSERTGGSKAWIYHYYDSKEAILFDVLDSYIRRLLDTVRDADNPKLDPRERLRRLTLALLQAYSDAHAQHAVQLNDLGRLPEDQQEQVKARQRQIVEVFAQALAAARPELAQRPDLLKPLTMSLIGMLNWHHRWFRRDGSLSLEGYVDLAVELLLDGLSGLSLPARRPERVGALAAGSRS